MRAQPLIAVTDVEASSRWYQRLLGCRSAHGGSEYERLESNGVLVMQLHRFAVEHHHGPIGTGRQTLRQRRPLLLRSMT
jgi:catechol-2,3-dioxygenase